MTALLVMVMLAQADGGAPPAADAGPLKAHPLEGVWQLDLEKSTDTAPILEKLGVNWFVRQVAKSARPVHRIRVNDNTLFLEIEASVAKKRFQLVLDGKTPTKDDFFGDALEYTTVLENGAFVSTGKMTDPAKKAGITLNRSLRDDGLMLYRITLLPDGKEPIVIDRVFRRKT
ncbi:MAG: hypothetical protein SFW67_30125 [Myxococcaceae bacterium]|nr:hypothetical protein [Myxococcaceae bacterium]